ncbi:MAG: protein kinase, partial [Planctomycetaceae bacterium]|nr:protein kinase [Planctomycetaceae bacterium]
MSSPGSRIDRACDRFEAQWRAGPRPRIEDYLRAFPEPQRPELFHQLLKVELELRRDRGDEPTPDGYRRQFPQYREQIDAVAFGRTTSLPPREPHPRSAGPKATADDNPLDHGALAAETQALTPEHLEGHGDAPQRSPAAPSSLGPVRPDPGRSADPEPQAGLFGASAARGPEEGPEATRTHRAGSSTLAGSPGAAGASTAPGPRFRVLRPHARGGLGEVFVAHDEELHRDVALKVIQDRYAGEPGHRSRFLLEAEVTGRLEHPGVVPVYGLGTSADGRPSYAMRFIRGESLKDAIARFHRAEGPGRDPGERAVAFRELLGRFLAVCHAIAYAHDRGVLHRDLKPGNVLLGKYGETLVVDWGLAKLIGRPEGVAGAEEGALRPPSASGSAVTAAGEAIGTPAYMSPEQAAGQPDRLGSASDVYSLGATLYCLLTGRAPFESPKPAVDVRDVLRQVQEGAFPPPRATGRAIPAALEAICLKAMARMPEDRYASSQALASDLEHWLADEPVTAYPEPWGPRLARWVRRHRTWAQAGAAALLAVAVISAGAALLVDNARRHEAYAWQRERAARDREDQQRRRAEALAEKRRQHLEALRAEGQELILKGQEALANQDWRDAKLRLSNALATLGTGPELAELKAHAARLLD